MASEVLQLTAQIVMAHASMTELSPQELVREIKEVHRVLASLAGEVAAPAALAPVARARKIRGVKMVASPEAKVVINEEGPAIGDQEYMEFMERREG